MATKNYFADGNRFLRSLSEADLSLLAPALEEVDLVLRQDLERPNKTIDHIHFLQSGIASVVANGNGTISEIGIIGCEGMTGHAVLLGVDQSPYSTYVQLKGG